MLGLAPNGAAPIGGFRLTSAFSDHKLTADPGVITLAGTPATLTYVANGSGSQLKGWRGPGALGAVPVGGFVFAAPSTTYTLTAIPGLYVQTRTAARLNKGYTLKAWTNHVTNGAFDHDTSGWTVSGADTTFTSVGGRGVLTLGPGASGGFVTQTVTGLVVGRRYKFSARVIPNATAHAVVRFGTTPGGIQGGGIDQNLFTGMPVDGFAFTLEGAALADTYYITLETSATHDCSTVFDDILIEETGSYAITGAPAAITKTGRILAALGGVYATSGSAAILTVARRAVADPGVYTQIGSNVSLLFGRRLVATGGSYAINGSPASISHLIGRFIHPEGGVLVVSGGDARLLYGRKMPAGPTTFSLTGAATNWIYRRTIKASPAVYAITGAATGLRIGYRVGAVPGAYVLSGIDLNLVNRRLTMGLGSYTQVGAPAGLLIGKRLQAASGAYSVTGAPAALLYKRMMPLAPGSYALAGANLAVASGRRLTAAGGSYALTGASALTRRGYTVHAVPGAYTIATTQLSVVTTRRMVAQASAYHLSWPDVALTPHWRPRGPRAIAVGFAESRRLSVEPQNRRVAVEPQDRRCSVEPAARRYAAVEPRDKELLGGSMLKWPEKDPNEVLDYELDWADPDEPRLEAGETLLTSVWSVVEGDVVINADPAYTKFTAQGLSTVCLSGGTPGTKCVLLNRVTTSHLPRSYDKEVSLRIRDH